MSSTLISRPCATESSPKRPNGATRPGTSCFSDPSDQELGRARLGLILEDTRRLAVSAVLDRLLQALKEHAAGRPLGDDTTLLIVERARL